MRPLPFLSVLFPYTLQMQIVLLPVYQIIFLNSYAEHTRKWIDAYQMRNEEGEVESKRSLMRRIYIYLPEINEIVKRKGFGKLNDFEQLC